ncbi:hypothetical protein [Pseudomonas sp. Q1-7]|uniref:hypothetical protein n=1 Tax=Pseudomonas sp. Q1-7 TaxID=3020843 RepID=UPI0022FFD301|nr:hypothetical protein [Pseudomonas sp. Q1-7]
MNGTNELDFHFIDLVGDITGQDRQPATTSGHRSLSLSRASLNRLLATHDSNNTGVPLPATTPSPACQEAVPVPSSRLLSSLTLAVDYSLPAQSTAVDSPPQHEEASQGDLPSEHAAPVPAAVEEVATGTDVQLEQHPEQDKQQVDDEPMPVLALLHPPTEEGQPAPLDQEPEERNDATSAESRDSLEQPAPSTVPHCGEESIAAPSPVEAEHSQESVAGDASSAAEVTPADDESQEEAAAVPAVLGGDAESVLGEVQFTLDSLAEMAKGLTQQRLDAVRQQDGLDKRKAQLQEKERQLADKEEQLRLLEARLNRECSDLERSAEDSARALAERSAALKALAESVEARDRSTIKLAETLRQEKLRNDELAETLLRRADVLDEREAALNRRNDELTENFKQLVAAKDRFRALVKAFNETVQFNDTLNVISSAALDDLPH